MGYLISEYDYDTDIEVKREEAVAEGRAEGRAEGDALRGEKDIATIKKYVSEGTISKELAQKIIADIRAS